MSQKGCLAEWDYSSVLIQPWMLNSIETNFLQFHQNICQTFHCNSGFLMVSHESTVIQASPSLKESLPYSMWQMFFIKTCHDKSSDNIVKMSDHLVFMYLCFCHCWNVEFWETIYDFSFALHFTGGGSFYTKSKLFILSSWFH